MQNKSKLEYLAKKLDRKTYEFAVAVEEYAEALQEERKAAFEEQYKNRKGKSAVPVPSYFERAKQHVVAVLAQYPIVYGMIAPGKRTHGATALSFLEIFLFQEEQREKAKGIVTPIGKLKRLANG